MKLLLYYFARFLLAPLLVIALLFVLNGIQAVKRRLSLKKLVIFLLLAALAAALPALFSLLNNEYVWGGLLCTLLAHLLLGVLFCRLAESELFGAIGIGGSRSALLLTLAATCVLGGWCYYLLFDWISGLPYALWSTAGILWLAVPYLVHYSRSLFLAIPQPIYTPWELSYGTFDRRLQENIDSFNTETVRVKIKRRIDDPSYASLVVRLPKEISLGNWFNWFIEDQNRRFPQNTIETERPDVQIGWMFYTPKWFRVPLFLRILDPRLDRDENRLRSNRQHTIYVRRVHIEINA